MRMGGWRAMGGLAAVVVLLAGCGARWPWASEAGETRLEGTKWQWVAGGSGGTPRAIEQPARYTIEFLPEYRLEVRADCNRAAGPWRTHDSAVTLGPFVVTRKPARRRR
jgi:heat shock protein HslJ